MSRYSKRLGELSPIKLALLAKQTRGQLETKGLLDAEPIAITGLGCRFPGGADNPNLFWELLENGVDAICEIPPDRWDADSFFDPDPAKPGKMTTRWGGFLQTSVKEFDPVFFGISPREAAHIDPQQRLVLEVAYEALEDAGQTLEHLSGSRTGVFIASYQNDYSYASTSNYQSIKAYTITGTSHSIVSNRVSFWLNLRGPSVTVDTACSSSLVAVHLACQSLRREECDQALAGGVNLILSPEVTLSLSKWGFMAPDGRCKTFDAKANGFVRGEGCGVIVLKRLADALAEGDPILALIRGSAVNQDGRTNVMTAPSGLAQQAVVRTALEASQVKPEQLTYIEAHGTGTSIGDPIEVEALTEIFGQTGEKSAPCALTSVKTNIGHLEAAAGMAGIIKVVLSMQKGYIPPHLHFSSLNPHISLEKTPFYIPTEITPWPTGAQRRFAGVSSFGFGGTNAHVILEEAPDVPIPPIAIPEDKPQILLLSAHTHSALQQRLQDVRQDLAARSEKIPLSNYAYTAAIHRTHYADRTAIVGTNAQEIIKRLDSSLEKQKHQAELQTESFHPKIAFVCSGQGPQWWAMGRGLLEHEPVFQEALTQIDKTLREHADWSLLEELTRSEAESQLNQTVYAQPALFAIQVGLAALWKSYGITPQAVIGHSLGEIAAAYIAGIINLEQAVQIVVHRGRIMQQATGLGKMVSVEIPPSKAKAAIQEHLEHLAVAAINSPNSCVLSGKLEFLEMVVERLQSEGVNCRWLPVDYAFHSPQMAPFQAELEEQLRNLGLTPNSPSLPIYSSVSGNLANDISWDASYWGRNIRQSVCFANALQAMANDDYTIFLELGPHPVLAMNIQDGLRSGGFSGQAVASLRRKRDDRECILLALGELFELGCKANWEALYATGQVISLPPYPWQRESFWLPPTHKSQWTSDTDTHPLLGTIVQSPVLKGNLYQNQISIDAPAFLTDHRILGINIVPMTAYIEMALAASKETANVTQETLPIEIGDLQIQEALSLPDSGSCLIQLHRQPSDEHSFDFKIFSKQETSEWNTHAQGWVGQSQNFSGNSKFESIDKQIPPDPNFYEKLSKRGLEFGTAFQGICAVSYSDDEIQAKIEIPESLLDEIDTYHFHPALLDACLQPISMLLLDESESLYLPVQIGRLRIFRSPSSLLWSRGHLLPTSDSNVSRLANIQIFASDGQPVAEIIDLRLQRVKRSALLNSLQNIKKEWLYGIDWQLLSTLETPASQSHLSKTGSCLIVNDSHGVGEKLAGLMKELGIPCQMCDSKQISESETLKKAKIIIHFASLDLPPAGEGSLTNEQNTSLGSLLNIIKMLHTHQNEQCQLWLVTQGAQAVPGTPAFSIEQAPTWGLGRTLQLEQPNLATKLVDLDPAETVEEQAQRLLAELLATDTEDQIAHRDGQRYAPRIAPIKTSTPATKPSEEPKRLTISQRGALQNLTLSPTERLTPGPGEIEIRVRASGLNFRDVLNALGLYPGEPGPLGDECSGDVIAIGADVTELQPGDAVFGLAPACFGTHATTRAKLVVKKPEWLSYEQAATIPIPFLTAHYALNHLAGLSNDQRVLIHAGTGGVGMAAIQLAKLAGAEIFATAGNPEKRAVLKTLNVKHIYDSRTLDFSDAILAETDGQGVDAILNALAGEFIPKSFAVLSERGCFLEIGKTNIFTPEQAAKIRPEGSYHVIFIGDLIREQPAYIQSMLQELLDMFERGDLTPLPQRVFPLKEAAEAFRYMAQAKHIGKIVLIQRERQVLPENLNAHGSYLITGAFGGIGPHLARWMVEHGAKRLVLASRRGESAPGAKELAQELTDAGAEVILCKADLARPQDVMAVIGAAGVPLRGVIHAAGIVADGMLQQQEWSNFERALLPKLDAPWLLHRLTQGMPLDFFVLFSSAASVMGSQGQANYAAGNAFLDALAHFRQSNGLAALSINWAGWENLGMTAAISERDRKRWEKLGLSSIAVPDGLNAFAASLKVKRPQIAVLPIDWPIFSQSTLGKQPIFRKLATPDGSEKVTETTILHQPKWLLQWDETPINHRRTVLTQVIRGEAIRVLDLVPGTQIDARRALNELGLDSLTAVEMRNRLSQLLEEPLPSTLLFDFPTCEALADYLLKSVPRLAKKKSPESTNTATEDAKQHPAPIDTDDIRKLSDEEAEALLLAELEELKKTGKKKQ